MNVPRYHKLILRGLPHVRRQPSRIHHVSVQITHFIHSRLVFFLRTVDSP